MSAFVRKQGNAETLVAFCSQIGGYCAFVRPIGGSAGETAIRGRTQQSGRGQYRAAAATMRPVRVFTAMDSQNLTFLDVCE